MSGVANRGEKMACAHRMSGVRRVSAWAASALMAACGGGGSGDPGAGSAPPVVAGVAQAAGHSLHANPTDPALYTVGSESGETFTFIGHRSATGVATRITGIEYTTAGGERYRIEYGAGGLPARVVDAAGTVVSMRYALGAEQPTAGDAVPKAAGRRQVQWVDTMVALGQGSPARPDGPVELRTRWTPAAGSPAAVRTVPDSELRPAEPPGNVDVRVTRCGVPVGASSGVYVQAVTSASGTPRLLPAEPTGQAGLFRAQIPTRQANLLTGVELAPMCRGMASTLSSFCNLFDPFDAGEYPHYAGLFDDPVWQASVCAQVSAAMALTPLAPAAPQAFAACAAAWASKRICDQLDTNAPVPGAPSVFEGLCDLAATVDPVGVGYDQYSVQAHYVPDGEAPALGEPGRAGWGAGRSDAFRVPATGPFPTLAIDLRQPWVGLLGTLPDAPRAGQAYTASAEFSCASGLPRAIEASRDNAASPLARLQAAGTAAGTATLQLAVPATPRGRLDTLVARLGDPSSPDTGARRTIHVALDAAASDPTVPIRFTGTGRSVDSLSHPQVNNGVPVRCESTAEWAITVNPGGTFRGSYRNPRPNLVQTLGGYRCETRATPLEAGFSGTYRDGRFELRPNDYYYTGTSRLFLRLQDVMVGDLEAGRMVTRPNYDATVPPVPPGSIGSTLRIEHAFDLRPAP